MGDNIYIYILYRNHIMIMVDTESGSIELGCRLAFFGCAFDFAATGGSGTHLRREMHTCIYNPLVLHGHPNYTQHACYKPINNGGLGTCPT